MGKALFSVDQFIFFFTFFRRMCQVTRKSPDFASSLPSGCMTRAAIPLALMQWSCQRGVKGPRRDLAEVT